MNTDTPEQIGALRAMETFAQAVWWWAQIHQGIQNPGNWSLLPKQTRKGWRRHARSAFVGVLGALMWGGTVGG